MIKYYIEYYDVVEVLHRIEISSDSFSGVATRVEGYAELEYMDVDDVLESIRGSGMRINLEASTDLTFEDLYSDVERTFKVTYYRAGQIKFIGFLNPDGMYQDWVYDKWEISLDVSGGLGYLKNLSYPATGGLEREINIIAKCLKRTGLELEICTRLITEYDTQPAATDVLDNVYEDSERFIKSDGETTMSCEEVLRGVLEKYCASIFQNNGKWYIVHLPHLTMATNNYYVYNSSGTYLRMESFGFGTTVGSDINSAYPHHCGGNQRIEMQPSIGAYRVNYKYGLVKNINENPNFDGMSEAPKSIPSWTINNASKLNINSIQDFIEVIGNGSSITDIITNTPVSVSAGSSMTLEFDILLNEDNASSSSYFAALLGISDGTSTRYLKNWYTNDDLLKIVTPNMEWVSAREPFFIKAGNLNVQQKYKIDSIPFPFDGTIEFVICSPQNLAFPALDLSYFVYSAEMIPKTDNDDPEGEFHTFDRITQVSSVIRDTKEITVADSPLNIYTGALYKNDQTTLTESWIHGSKTGNIIRVMGFLTMQAFQKPAKIFKGSVFGYLNFPGGYYVDGVVGGMVITEYKYNTKDNITDVKAIEVFSNDIDDDVAYKKTIDYGETSSPTIK